MSNVNFNVKVTGATALAQLNAAIATYSLNVVKISASQSGWNYTIQTTAADLLKVQQQLASSVKQLNETTKAQDNARFSMANMLAGYVKFRIVSGIFNEVTSAINDATKAVREYDLQTARTLRATGDANNARGVVGSQIAYGTVASGRSIKDVGEVMYQVRTYVHDAATATLVFNDAMKLLVGTQGDARETTRLIIQLYSQFGDTMGATLTPAEKMHRITEMIAVAFKDANAEVGELAQSMKYLGPIAAALHVPMEQAMAFVTALTGEGQRGRMSGTGVSSLLNNLAKNYDTELGGIVDKGIVYKFKLEMSDDGKSVDLLKTTEGIAKTWRDLARVSIQDANHFLEVVGHNAQAVRVLGVEQATTLANLHTELNRMTDAEKGMITPLEDIEKQMQKSFDVAAARAWAGVINEVAQNMQQLLSTVLGVKDGLGSVASVFADIQSERALTQQHLGLLTSEGVGPHAERLAGIGITVQSEMDRIHPHSSMSYTDLQEMMEYRARMMASMQSDTPYGQLQISNTLIDRYNAELSAMWAAMRQRGLVARNGQIDSSLLGSFIGQMQSLSLQNTPYAGSGTGGLLGFSTGTGLPDTDAYLSSLPVTKAQVEVKSPKLLAEEARKRAAEAKRRLEERIASLKKEKQLVDEKLKEIVDDNDADIGAQLDALRNHWMSVTLNLADLEKDKRTPYAILKGKDAWSEARGNVHTNTIKRQYELLKAQFKTLLDNDPNDPKLRGMANRIDEYDVQFAKQDRNDAGVWDATHSGARKELQDALDKNKDKSKPDTTTLSEFMANIVKRFITYPISRDNEKYQNSLNTNLSGMAYGLGVDPLQAQLGLATANKASAQTLLNKLTSLKAGSDIHTLELDKAIDTATKELEKFGLDIAHLNADMAVRNFQHKLEDVDRNAAQQRFNLNLNSGRRAGETADQFQRRQLGTQYGEYSIAVQSYNSLQRVYNDRKEPLTPDEQREHDQKLQAAANAIATAAKELHSTAASEFNTKFDAAKTQVSNTLNGVILDFAHGRKGAGSAISALGGQVYDSLLLKAVKPFTDPLIGAIAHSMAATQLNTNALNALTVTLGGSAPDGPRATGTVVLPPTGGIPGVLGAAIGLAGVFGGLANSAKGAGTSTFHYDPNVYGPVNTRAAGDHTPSGRNTGSGIPGSVGNAKWMGKAGTFLNEGLAGLGAFQAGQQSGPLAGTISGALAGSSFGPVGAIIGGGLGLLGGLLGGHHHSNPAQDQRDRNPAFQNSPEDFVYDAYRFRLGGGMPSAASLGMSGAAFNHNAASIVTVNTYNDGVKTATTRALSNATSLGVAGQANHTVDIHSPL